MGKPAGSKAVKSKGDGWCRPRLKNGRFQKVSPVKEAEPEEGSIKLKPSQCGAHMKKRLSEEFPKIVDGFIEQAKSGQCQHVKLATELLGAKRSSSPREEKGVAQKLVEEWLR